MRVAFLLRRLFQMALVMWLVATLVFVIFRLVPGDPAVLIVGPDAPIELLEQVREDLGLNDPIVVQYGRWWLNALQGDLGTAHRSGGIPVTDLLVGPLLRTLELATAGMALALVLAIPLGVMAALRQGSWLDQAVRAFAVTGFSLPPYILALLLLHIFARILGILPSGGYVEVTNLGEHLTHLLLPMVTVGLTMAGVLVRFVYSSMLDVLGTDYVRTARAKGVAERHVTIRHALRNAGIPVLTVAGVQFGLLVGGMVLVEIVFAWPGLGWLMVQSIANRSYDVVQAAVLVSGAIFVVVNTAVDIAYSYLDPQVSVS